MVKTKKSITSRVTQGDIISDIEYIENVTEKEGVINISKIIFPLAIVLTQDCDLEQDYKFRWSSKYTRKNEDKWLLSVIVAPIYNIEHFFAGDHLSEIGMLMNNTIKKKDTLAKNIMNNETPRYHYLEFPKEIAIPPSIIDFKHYFSANVAYLKKHKKNNFVCQIGTLFREDISHRYTSYLSRIGLPEFNI